MKKMATLYYDFDDNGREDFEYELFDDDEAMDYILRTRSIEEILDDFKECFPDRADMIREYDEEELQDPDIIKSDFLLDLIYQGFYNDELKEYFEDEAYQYYVDCEEDEKYFRNLPR